MIIFNAKISALQRMVAMQGVLLENKQKLQQYHKQNELEQSFAQNVFETLISQNELDDKQLDYWIKPSKKFSGDLISVKRVAQDQLYFLLADSTGHGLSAALPTIIVNQVFQRMSDKKHSISMIVREINTQLKQHIPVGHFVALAIGVVDSTRKEIKLWNGGLDNVLLLNNNNQVTHDFSSRYLACGVLNDEEFDDTLATVSWDENSELFLYSDGLTDVIDEKNALFGEQKLMDILLTAPTDQRLQGIKKAIMQYGDFNKEQDDISCLFILCE
jgi:serine phosphatase RsbU (regulator of sigma subunit)